MALTRVELAIEAIVAKLPPLINKVTAKELLRELAAAIVAAAASSRRTEQ